MSERYRVLVADCPWQFGDTLGDNTRGAASNYDTMSVDQLCRFPLPPMYESSTLFFWRVAAMQREALAVIDAWDFEVKCELVWNKLTKTGKPFFGLGHTVRGSHEVCLIATSGRPVTLNKSIRSTFSAKVPVDGNGEYIHSAKPAEFYNIVEQLRAGPYVELFARRPRRGWKCMGDQVCKTCDRPINEPTRLRGGICDSCFFLPPDSYAADLAKIL